MPAPADLSKIKQLAVLNLNHFTIRLVESLEPSDLVQSIRLQRS